jgi:hypothetical protein
MKIPSVAILAALLVLSGCGAIAAVPASDLQHQGVHSIDLSSGEIFDKSQEWLALTFVDSKAVIESANRDTGKIIGAGATSISPMTMLNIPVRFTIIIEAKEGRYRTTYTNYVAYHGTYQNQPIPVQDQISADLINQKLVELDISLLEYLQGSDKDEW